MLVIDIGGNNVKILATGQNESRKFPSGCTLTSKQMVAGVKKLAGDWKYDVVSIGYPGMVVRNRLIAEPHNLGRGWMGFDFEAAFKRPVKVVNDAAMQALGSYKHGKMLFLGLEPDDVVLGGGNVKKLKELPRGCREGDNANAFLGGFRLWEKADKRRSSIPAKTRSSSPQRKKRSQR